jgi:hypothetical protein
MRPRGRGGCEASMMELVCLVTTLAIYLSYHHALPMRDGDGVVHGVLSALLLTCAQIVLTELALGLAHGLYLSLLIIVNLSIAASMVSAARRLGAGPLSVCLRGDALRIKTGMAAALDIPAIVLGMLALLTYGWILTAAYVLPPRGVDDLAYHLPAVFEYVRSHEIRLLPVHLLSQFAFPENGELLFLWPVMFTHAQRWVDGVNVPFVVLSVLTLFAILRRFELSGKDSIFVALLYAFCPIILMQAGVNYVDTIVSLFLLLSIYFALRYHQQRQPRDLLLAGLAIGLLCGMKYTALFLVLPLQMLIIPVMLKGKGRYVLGYAGLIVLAGGWWYLRNVFVLGAPLFPVQFQPHVPDAFVNARGGSMLQNFRYNLPYWIARYPLTDSGLGTYDGGFGLVFWGMGLTSWAYVTVRSILTLGRSTLPLLTVLAYLPLGFLLLLVLPPRYVDFDGRLAVFVAAVGLVALAEVLRVLGNRTYVSSIKVLCVILSVLSVSLLPSSQQPSYSLGRVFADKRSHRETSEFRYLSDSIELHAVLRPAWELLDLLTRDDAAGLNCYVASDPPLYSPSPAYGSRLQNCVLNLSKTGRGPVDVYLCSFLDRNRLERPLTGSGVSPDPGLRGATNIRQLLESDGYVTVEVSDHTCLLLRRDVFERPEKQQVLGNYYRTEWPEAVAAARELEGKINGRTPVVTSREIGYGIRVVDRERGRPDRTYLTLEGGEGNLLSRKDVRQCYTFGRPPAGYRSRKVASIVYKKKPLDVYLNRRS